MKKNCNGDRHPFYSDIQHGFKEEHRVKKKIFLACAVLALQLCAVAVYADGYTEYDGIVKDYVNKYGSGINYTMFDLDQDGINELIISCGSNNADWKNDVYSIRDGQSLYVGEFPFSALYYENIGDSGLISVYGHQGYQVVNLVKLGPSGIEVSTISEGDAGSDYYSNDVPLPQKPIRLYGKPYIVEGTDQRYVTADDLAGLDVNGVMLAKNEIYARHGRMFAMDFIRHYFERQSWYEGTIPGDAFSDAVFNSYEVANIDFIANYESQFSSVSTENYSEQESGGINPQWYKNYSHFDGEDGSYVDIYALDGSFDVIEHYANGYSESYHFNENEYVIQDNGSIGYIFGKNIIRFYPDGGYLGHYSRGEENFYY